MTNAEIIKAIISVELAVIAALIAKIVIQPVKVVEVPAPLSAVEQENIKAAVQGEIAPLTAAVEALLAQVPVTTTVAPQVTTTVAPEVTTTVAPQVTTTVAPEVTTTVAPQVTTTVAP